MAVLSWQAGWVHREARYLVPEGACPDIVNLVPDEYGALVTRQGHLALTATPLDEDDVHSLYTSVDQEGTVVRYQGAGRSLYRDFQPLITGLSGRRIDFASLRGFQEQAVYTFFGGGQDGLRMKDDGTTLTQWGLTPPSIAPTVVLNAISVKSFDTFNSATIDTDYTPTDCTLSRTLTTKQEGASALTMTVAKDTSAQAVRTITAVDATSYGVGSPALDDDPIHLQVHVTLLSNLDRIEVAFNFGTVAFTDGYYTTTITPADLTPADRSWSELLIPKDQFKAIGTTTASWAAITGIRLEVVTNPGGPTVVTFDDLKLQGGAGLGNGPFKARYRWKQVLARRAKPLGLHVAHWPSQTDLTADAQDAGLNDVPLTTLVNNEGHTVGAEGPFAEVIYAVTTVQSGGTPVYEYTYWNGTAWIVFTPDILPDFATLGVTRLQFSFPTTNWLPDGSDRYTIRLRATTAPTAFAPLASTVAVYDSVVAARSNPSPESEAVRAGRQTVTVGLVNPSVAGVDFDPQVTHVEIYRTTGGATAAHDPYLFDGDVPVGVLTYLSHQLDTALGEILETDNDRPLAFEVVTEHQERIWGAIENELYPSKQFKPESFPRAPLEVGTRGDPIVRIRQYDGILYVFTATRIYQILGTDKESYIPRQIQCPTGLGAPWSLARGERGSYFLGGDDHLWILPGTANAINLSQARHAPLFQGKTFNDIRPLNRAQRDECVGAWANLRYYFFYPQTGSSVPDAGFFIDEQTETWWRDSRDFRSLWYDRHSNALLGGTGRGDVMQLESGVMDDGEDIAWTVTTRDSDEGSPEADKELLQVSLELASSGLPVTVVANTDYGTGTIALGTVSSTILGPQRLPGTAETWRALGFTLSGTGVVRLHRLFPQVAAYPATRIRLKALPQTLGWPGDKRIEAVFLDIDQVDGAATFTLNADGTDVHTITTFPDGRQFRDVLPATFDATLLSWTLESTGSYRLYDSSHVVWIPLPPIVQSFRSVATDLSMPGVKCFSGFYLDVEVPGTMSGTVTVTFIVDGTPRYTLPLANLSTRQRLGRLRLPDTVTGKLLEMLFTGTRPLRLWPGTEVEWYPLGEQPALQKYRVIEQAYGQVRQTPLTQFLQGAAAA